MGIYTLVFSVYLRIGIHNYALFLLAGLIPWTWFAGALQQGTGSILDGRMYVGKTLFPTDVLVIVPVLSNFVNFLFSLPLLLIVIAFFHGDLGWPLLALPLIVACQMILTLGLLFFVATWNVFYRDFQQLMVYLVMFLFYLTPIFYPLSRVPEHFRGYVMASPLALLAVSYQDIFYYNVSPPVANLVLLAFGSVIVLILARLHFERHKESFGEYL